MGIITMQIVSTEHLIALSPWSIKRYDRKVSAGKIVDCLFFKTTCILTYRAFQNNMCIFTNQKLGSFCFRTFTAEYSQGYYYEIKKS